jgi:hypothetical protein
MQFPKCRTVAPSTLAIVGTGRCLRVIQGACGGVGSFTYSFTTCNRICRTTALGRLLPSSESLYKNYMKYRVRPKAAIACRRSAVLRRDWQGSGLFHCSSRLFTHDRHNPSSLSQISIRSAASCQPVSNIMSCAIPGNTSACVW